MKILEKIIEQKTLIEIEQLNFQMLKMKLMDKDDGEGWTYQECENAEWKYKMFLKLIYLYPNESVVPDREMDKFWHYHILDTRDYITITSKIFGKYIHHYPYFGLNGAEGKQDLKNCFDRTQTLLKKHFNFSLKTQSSSCTSGDDDGSDSSTCASRCRN